MPEDRMLTTAEVAERLRVTVPIVRKWLRAGLLRGVQLPSRRAGWRVPESELDRFMAGQADAGR